MKKQILSVITAATLVLGATLPTANAAIISVTGAAINAGSAPADLSHGTSENDVIQGFIEDTGISLIQAISVDYDITDEGNSLTGFNTGTNQGGGNGSLLPGTYNSHLIHFDPVGSFNGTKSASGSFTFDSDILALIVSFDFLEATDSLFNGTTTNYLNSANPIGRRSESSDLFSFVGTTLTIEKVATSKFYVDHIRVITESDNLAQQNKVSAPATASIFILGCIMVAMRRFK